MNDVQALTFDVGGSVLDWQSPIRSVVGELAAARGAQVDPKRFALDWRAGMFRILASVRRGELPWMNSDDMHRRALDELAGAYPQLTLSDEDRAELNRIWHRLPAWEDFPDAMERLRERYRVVVLTLLSFSMVVDCSRFAGLRWDGILSCEFLGHYKPEPEAYQAAARLLGLQPSQVMMVASHTADLQAAGAAGLRTAYVQPKLEEPDFPGWVEASADEFDLAVESFTELADRLCG
ncbi:MAG: haloacid dehalogenase type II [Gemmatimonadota bacterium]